MFGDKPTYHGNIRGAIVGFGNFFSNIYIERRIGDSVNGEVGKKIHVPLAFSNKEKWLTRIRQDPKLENNTYISLPRMSFELVGYTYDPMRKVGKMNPIRCGNNRLYSPVPYNLELNLNIMAKTDEDGLQILEQILPVFTPEYTISLRSVAEMNIVQDVPIVLNSVSLQDDYDGDFQMRRAVIHTLSFQMKMNLFGAARQPGNVILKTNVGIDTTNDGTADRTHTSIGDEETGEILFEGWE